MISGTTTGAPSAGCSLGCRLLGQNNISRISIPQDQDSKWHHFPILDPNAVPEIEFKVCQERQDDPDLCTGRPWYNT